MDQIERIHDALLRYNYSELIKGAEKIEPPIAGNVLDPEDFAEYGIYLDIAKSIKDSEDTIVILAGATRMGKSSLAQSIWDKSQYSRISMDDGSTLNQLDKKKSIWIIEEPQNMDSIARFLSSGGAETTLIISGLKELDGIITALQEKGLKPKVVFLPLLDQGQMSGYISKVLRLKPNDELVSKIAELTGGCPFVANIIIQRLVLMATFFKDKLLSLKWIAETKYSIGSQIQDWDDLRQYQEGEYKHFVPDPELARFY